MPLAADEKDSGLGALFLMRKRARAMPNLYIPVVAVHALNVNIKSMPATLAVLMPYFDVRYSESCLMELPCDKRLSYNTAIAASCLQAFLLPFGIAPQLEVVLGRPEFPRQVRV